MASQASYLGGASSTHPPGGVFWQTMGDCDTHGFTNFICKGEREKGDNRKSPKVCELCDSQRRFRESD